MLKSGVILKLSIWKDRHYPHRRDDDPRYVWRLLCCSAWANNVKLRMPRSRIRIMQAILAALSLVLARVWQWAVTWRLLYRHSSVLAACLVLCHRHCIGSWFGARFTLLPIFRIPVKCRKFLPPHR